MEFTDYSPPISPSPAQQQDALRKGLGRALIWAKSGRLDSELLLQACLKDQRFDKQIDASRGDWLWQMIQTVGANEHFRVPILHALYNLSDEDSACQICELARCYAATGDEPFRTRLYEIVEQKPFGYTPWLGEEEIIALDGEPGFLFSARLRGRMRENFQGLNDELVECAAQHLGQERVRILLDQSSDEAIKSFREEWQQEVQMRAAQQRSFREKMASVPVEEIIRDAEGKSQFVRFRGWGKYANEADLRMIFERLRTEKDPRVIANLLRVFSARALPEFNTFLLELCRHRDEEVRRRAFAALEHTAHPLVREFALNELSEGLRDAAIAALFINNYQPGDEHRILEALELPIDPCELHWLLMKVRKVLEKNTSAECSRLGVISYALTPCGCCRYSAARVLRERRGAPSWLTEECQYDSESDIRDPNSPDSGPTKAR